jgi:transcriptional regulator with XRE-family HTH domain
VGDIKQPPSAQATKSVVLNQARRQTIAHLREEIMGVIARRLKHARIRAGMSQEGLGLASGLDEMSASARMNRYEKGTRTPNPELVERFATALDLPSAYFYAVEDILADLIVRFYRLDKDHKAELFKRLAELEKSQLST